MDGIIERIWARSVVIANALSDFAISDDINNCHARPIVARDQWTAYRVFYY